MKTYTITCDKCGRKYKVSQADFRMAGVIIEMHRCPRRDKTAILLEEIKEKCPRLYNELTK